VDQLSSTAHTHIAHWSGRVVNRRPILTMIVVEPAPNTGHGSIEKSPMEAHRNGDLGWPELHAGDWSIRGACL
jgi:hypothetical protein